MFSHLIAQIKVDHQVFANEILNVVDDARLPGVNSSVVNLNPPQTYISPYLHKDAESNTITISDQFGGSTTLNFDYCLEFLPEDIDDDCQVGLSDFAILAAQWLGCSDPENPNCF